MIFSEPPKYFSPKYIVVAAFVEYKGKFLILKRNSLKPSGGKWGLPAGKVDGGEDKLSAINREVWEETGLKATDFHFESTLFVKLKNFDIIYHTYKLAVSEEYIPRLRLDEHTDYKWVLPEEALKLDLIEDLDVCIKYYYSL